MKFNTSEFKRRLICISSWKHGNGDLTLEYLQIFKIFLKITSTQNQVFSENYFSDLKGDTLGTNEIQNN